MARVARVARPRANAMGVMVGTSKHALRKLRDVPHDTFHFQKSNLGRPLAFSESIASSFLETRELSLGCTLFPLPVAWCLESAIDCHLHLAQTNVGSL